jgi:hypothetical protein
MHSADYELGFVGAAVKAAGGIAKGLGKLGKGIKKRKQAKKKKAAKGKVTVLEPQNIVGQVPSDAVAKGAAKAIKKAASKSASPDDIVRQLVAAVPPLLREAVLDALKTAAANGAQKEQTLQTISTQVDDALKPQLAAMLGALEAQQLSRQATHEHQQLVDKQNFQDGTTSALKAINERLSQLEGNIGTVQKRLGAVAILQPSKVPLFGNRNIFD